MIEFGLEKALWAAKLHPKAPKHTILGKSSEISENEK